MTQVNHFPEINKMVKHTVLTASQRAACVEAFAQGVTMQDLALLLDRPIEEVERVIRQAMQRKERLP